jgi:hypothetical protein
VCSNRLFKYGDLKSIDKADTDNDGLWTAMLVAAEV